MLGSAAWDDLYVALRAPAQELRREAALLFAEQTVADAVPALIRALAEDAEDTLVASELTVLTCVDHRATADPTEEWYKWWDTVDQRSPLSWFRAACEARGLRPPLAEAFVGSGTREAREFLVAVMASGDTEWFVERARRELGRMLGRDLGAIPGPRDQRRVWLETLHERLDDVPVTTGTAPASVAPEGGAVRITVQAR